MTAQIFKETSRHFSLGHIQSYKNMSIIPVFGLPGNKNNYISLNNALSSELLEISEVSESGSVSTLKAVNKHLKPVLIIDGQELKGAKQNRIVNTTILLAPKQETLIPVSCTERGRWGYNSNRNFSDAQTMMSAKARYAKMERVHENLNFTGSFAANQGEVWSEVNLLHGKLNTFSQTEAMHDIYTQKRSNIKDYTTHFQVQKDQIGVIVFVDEQFAGFDFFARADFYGEMHEKIMKSHILEAMGSNKSDQNISIPEELAQHVLDDLDTMPWQTFKSVSLGEEWRAKKQTLSTATLVFEEEVVHWTGYGG